MSVVKVCIFEVYVRNQVMRVSVLSTNISIGFVHGINEFVHDVTEFLYIIMRDRV